MIRENFHTTPESTQMSQTPPGSSLQPDFLEKFDTLIALGKWGSHSVKQDVERTILDPLEKEIRKNVTRDGEQKDYITALRSLASNLHSLGDFAERVFTGIYRNTTFTPLKVSRAGAFGNLGINVKDVYSVDTLLQVTESKVFKSLHACESVVRVKVLQFKGGLKNKQLLYPGDSEHVARAVINAHLEFLFDLNHIISSILELWLARSTSERQPVVMQHTDRNRTHRTYLTGCTDYMVLAIMGVADGLPTSQAVGIDRDTILEKLDLANFKQRLYSDLPGHLTGKSGDDQGWEALFLKAKSISLFSRGRIDVSNLYQVITTCCIAGVSGRKAHKVLKFSLSSGHHWIFGVVDNTTASAYVTTILDNSDFRRTRDVLHLLVLWMVLPGPILKDYLFAEVTPQLLLPNIEAKSESQTRTGTNEGKIPKVEGEEGNPNKDGEDLAKEEEGRRGDADDEEGDSGVEDEKDENDEGDGGKF